MLRNVKRIATAIALCLVLAGTALAAEKRYEEPEFIWKVGHQLAATHPYQYGLEYMAKLIDERTGGRIRMDIFPASQLGAERALVEGIQMGTIDIALATGPMANFDPNFYINDLPNLFTSKEHAYRVLDGEIGQEILAGLDKVGMKGISFWETGYLCMFNNKKLIKTPEDLVGMNLRTMENLTYINYFTALGCNPVPMAYSEFFTSVQNDTVNGTLSPIPTIYTDKTYQLAPYITDSRQWYCPVAVLMSPATWDTIDAETQAIVMQAAKEARDYERKMLAELEVESAKQITAGGGTIFVPDQAVWQAQEEAIKASWASIVPDKISQELIDRIQALAD